MSLAIISFDAVSDCDLEFFGTLEHFSALLRRGTLVTGVSSVFISNTYPAHCSVITGALPRSHGIIENLFPNAGVPRPHWRCRREYIQTTTLYDEARRAGLKTCAIFWPVTAGADIYKNMPEVVPREGESQLSVSLGAGSKRFQIASLLRHGGNLRGISQPGLDNFAAKSAVSAARARDFDLLLLHLTDVDSHKHRFGPQSEQARDAMRRLDARLGALMRAYDGWDFIVFGDHGCKSVLESVNLNNYWCGRDGFWHLAGGCAFLHGGADGARELAQNPECHIKRVLSAEEMASSGLEREFSLGVEAEDGYCFAPKPYLGNHGYSLENDGGYKVFYLASGKSIGQNARAEGGCITDIAPLAAKMLGVPLWNMDGKLNTEVYHV